MSRAIDPPDGTKFLRGEIAAIQNWHREDGEEAYHPLLHQNVWEVALPELAFTSLM